MPVEQRLLNHDPPATARHGFVTTLALEISKRVCQGRQRSKSGRWVGKCLDLSKAYKQLPVHPSHRDLAVIFYGLSLLASHRAAARDFHEAPAQAIYPSLFVAQGNDSLRHANKVKVHAQNHEGRLETWGLTNLQRGAPCFM